MTQDDPAEERKVSLKICPVCSTAFAVVRHRGWNKQRYCKPECRRKAEIAKRPKSGTGRGNRRPLPEFAKNSGWILRRDVERLERIFADDRFPQYRQQVAAQLSGHLKYAAEVCQDLLSRLDQIGD